MTIRLPDDLESLVLAEVRRGQFATPDDAVAEIVTGYFRQLAPLPAEPPVTAMPPAANDKPIWEVADEIRKSVPTEEWAKIPKDGAAQLDHYLYGLPKRPTS